MFKNSYRELKFLSKITVLLIINPIEIMHKFFIKIFYFIFIGIYLTPFSLAEEDLEFFIPQPKPPSFSVDSSFMDKQWKYESCKGVDPSLFIERDTEAKFCFLCSVRNFFGTENLENVVLNSQSKSKTQEFKDKIRSRVRLQIESKIYQTQFLRACVTQNEEWFKSQKIDWKGVQEGCQKRTEDMQMLIGENWSEMRINRVLSSTYLRRIINMTGNSHFSIRSNAFDLLNFSHKSSVFKDTNLSKLTESEEKEVRKRLAEYFLSVSISGLDSSELAKKIINKKSFGIREEGSLPKTPKERRSPSYREIQQKVFNQLGTDSEKKYFEILSQLPLLGYMEKDNPIPEDLDQALLKVEKNLNQFLKETYDHEKDIGLFLAFEHLVEDFLKEDQSYCLIADEEKIKANRNDEILRWSLVGTGVIAGIPCFMGGVLTAGGAAVACLGAGLASGVAGYKDANTNVKRTYGGILTGEQLDNMASLDKREREEFLAKVFLPLVFWGSTVSTGMVI